MAHESGSFQVDPEAHAAAKVTGNYNTPADDTEAKAPEAPKDDEKDGKSLISDVDPGDGEDSDGTKPDDDTPKTDKDDDADEKDDAPKEDTTVFEQWADEFTHTGALSEETRKSVIETIFSEKVPEDVRAQFVEGYEQGLASLRSAAAQQAFDLVGGEVAYKAMAEWAVKNLDETEITAFDADALGQDVTRRNAAIKGLHARMQQATGSSEDFEPNLAHDGGRASGEPIIGSRQELARIQRTKEYQTDPAVRAKVARQLRQSMSTGKYIS